MMAHPTLPWLWMTTLIVTTQVSVAAHSVRKEVRQSEFIIRAQTTTRAILSTTRERWCLWRIKLSLAYRITVTPLQPRPILPMAVPWVEVVHAIMGSLSLLLPQPTRVMCSTTGLKTVKWFPILPTTIWRWRRVRNMWQTSNKWMASSSAKELTPMRIYRLIPTILILCHSKSTQLMRWVVRLAKFLVCRSSTQVIPEAATSPFIWSTLTRLHLRAPLTGYQ